MGRGTIVGAMGDGLYSVQLDYGAAEKTARLAVLTNRLADAQAALAAQQEIVQTYEQRLTELLVEQDAAIDALAIAPDAEVAQRRRELEQKTGEVLVVRKALDQASTQVKFAEADVAYAELEKARTQLINAAPIVSAWCADYTVSASGPVATVEVPGEPVQTILAPACPVPAAIDGKVLKREFMSPEQAFFNAAILPGWQKHRPTYRVGTLLAKSDEVSTATVVLDAATSSAQSLAINQADTLVGIPVQYMTCNARAFEIGDRVLVRFDGPGWAAPKVIGFESNPKPCILWPQLDFRWRSLTDATEYIALPDGEGDQQALYHEHQYMGIHPIYDVPYYTTILNPVANARTARRLYADLTPSVNPDFTISISAPINPETGRQEIDIVPMTYSTMGPYGDGGAHLRQRSLEFVHLEITSDKVTYWRRGYTRASDGGLGMINGTILAPIWTPPVAIGPAVTEIDTGNVAALHAWAAPKFSAAITVTHNETGQSRTYAPGLTFWSGGALYTGFRPAD